jgi:predicted ester cyclase
MSATDEAVVRRFYEEMNTGRKNELADELFTAEHIMHDPQVPTGVGPQGMVDIVSAYQQGVDGRWTIEEIFSTGDRVVVRWTGTGAHVAEINGIAPTGRPVRVDAISIHRMHDRKIAETWEVWDTLGFLQQLGVVPSS